jgi:rubrerythrin
MTVQSDIQKAIASCEAAKGSYAMMAQSTEDTQAKQMYNIMRADIDRHLQYLNGRMTYLNDGNQLNNIKKQK